MLASFITALEGLELTATEAALLKAARPCGIILFARNVADPAQVRRLSDAARDAVGHDILVLIDQEGGRVRRLRPPHWRELPCAAAYGRLYGQDPAEACRAARLAAQLTAAELRVAGINTNCVPVLDVPSTGSNDIIGDRAYGADPAQVAALGRAVAEGHMAGGVLPVIKHVPGHGRATADSHLELPVVTAPRAELERIDFAAFRRCADLPAAMTCPRRLRSHRPRSAGQHLAARDRGGRSRHHRLRRAAHERRSRHAGAHGLHGRAHHGRAGRGLRRGTGLQRRLGRHRGGSRGGASARRRLA